jgi:hypothetical protein
MPATFAHCLMTKYAIDILLRKTGGHPYIGILGSNDHFVIMGSTGPDYPYLTNPVFTGALKTVHSWADRMHYESVDKFVREGVAKLSSMDKQSDEFKICLPWFLGYVSHVIADSYVHPVINCIVGGPYIFTHVEHAKCEMVQDAFIFLKETDEEIIDANPRDNKLGFLTILDECSEPGSPDQLHHFVRDLWSELLRFAHPQGRDHFNDIVPDIWHKNYRSRFAADADPTAVFRHACGMLGVSVYERYSDIGLDDRRKYVEAIAVPDTTISTYQVVFSTATAKIITIWEKLFSDIETGAVDNVTTYIKDWNLDTGVNESKIDLWTEEG